MSFRNVFAMLTLLLPCSLAAAGNNEAAGAVADGASDVATVAASESSAVTAAANEQKPAKQSAWDKTSAFIKKGFKLSDEKGNYTLKIGARVHFLNSFSATDDRQNEVSHTLDDTFTVNAAKLRFSGNLFGKVFNYAVEGDFGGATPILQDCYIDLAFIPNKLHLQVGQYKNPIIRQNNNSSGRLEMTEGVFFRKRFGAQMDMGMALHNNYLKSPRWEWVVALMYGSSMSNIGTIHPRLSGRFAYNSPDMDSYVESDFRGGAFRWTLGVNAMVDFDAMQHKNSKVVSAIDFMFKVQHLAFQASAFIATKQDKIPDENFGHHVYGQSALYAQLSYLIAGQVAPIYRFAIINTSKDLPGCTENALGLTWYVVGHNLKLQFFGAARTNSWVLDGTPVAPENNRNTVDWRFNTQLVFSI